MTKPLGGFQPPSNNHAVGFVGGWVTDCLTVWLACSSCLACLVFCGFVVLRLCVWCLVFRVVDCHRSSQLGGTVPHLCVPAGGRHASMLRFKQGDTHDTIQQHTTSHGPRC